MAKFRVVLKDSQVKVLEERLRIAQNTLQYLSEQAQERFPGAASAMAEDALIQMSAVHPDDFE